VHGGEDDYYAVQGELLGGQKKKRKGRMKRENSAGTKSFKRGPWKPEGGGSRAHLQNCRRQKT